MRLGEARQLFTGVVVLVAGVYAIAYTHEWIAMKTGSSEALILGASGIALLAFIGRILR